MSFIREKNYLYQPAPYPLNPIIAGSAPCSSCYHQGRCCHFQIGRCATGEGVQILHPLAHNLCDKVSGTPSPP